MVVKKVIVISDSHDNLDSLSRLVTLKEFKESDLVIHLGDIVSPFALKILINGGKPIMGVFGNNDGDRSKLKEMCPSLVEQPSMITLKLEGGEPVNMLLFHGFGTSETTQDIIHAIARGHNEQHKKEIILYGHTHSYEIKKYGGVVVFNPGSLSGYLAESRTFGLISIIKGEIRIFTINLDTSKVVSFCKLAY